MTDRDKRIDALILRAVNAKQSWYEVRKILEELIPEEE